MADKKITQLTNITGANLVDADEFVVVDISADETKAITLGELKEAFDSGSGFVRITGDTMTGDLALSGADVTFGDNDKAIFGAGSDLQIYHDGNKSVIQDAGTGNLELQASTQITFWNAARDKELASFRDGEYCRLFYNGSQKLATTNTGVDITGTLTSDGLTVQGTTTTNGLNLDAISETITDTAVDVFVYDTSKDSDGGAWRKRTQGTSWYNETLNTATRGSRKEFPAVAVIVAENAKVTIYDGDDPDLPMWATQASSAVVFNAKAVTAKNGIVSVATTSGYVATFNFVKGGPWELYDAAGFDTWSGVLWGSIGSQISTDASKAIVNGNVNDVAMTVLPNAPIDAATGLPVPTIAVATDGGVSVIKDDGTVVDSASSIIVWVMFDEDTLYFEYSNSAKYQLISTLADGFSGYDFAESLVTTPIYAHGTVSDNANAVLNKNTISVGSSSATSGAGLGIYHKGRDDINYGSLASLDSGYRQAVITSTYNTGWMNGDIKLATLSDTDDTDVTGSELVTNGTFDTDVSGWSVVNSGTITWDSGNGGRALVTSTSGGGERANQAISTVVGKTYTVSVYVDSNSNNATPLLYINGSLKVQPAADYVGWMTHTFTASGTSTTIGVGWNAVVSGYYDSISVRLAEEDRSVNGKGLQVFGTVTKNPVATGADLVAYSGFSGSNYLFQPYNSDLAIGTGDYTCIVWMKKDTLGLYNDIFDFSDRSNTNRWEWLINSGGGLYVYIAGNSVVSGNGHFATGVWNCVAMTRRNGVVTHYINGKSVYSGTAAGIIGNTGCDLYVGVNYNGGNANGELSLLRISQTAASPEQIKKIYEDEKVLFQENAQATLYGSSDAVTALAYDDTTKILSVGTSAGRSDFQGLRRVNNTTNAVGAAISASNGLIVEE